MALEGTAGNRQSQALNDLYWNSSRTIDQIVDELGVGRNTLYASIRPEFAGVTCAACGEQIVYTNRTNRSAGTGTCPVCQTEVHVGEDQGSSSRTGAPRVERETRNAAWPDSGRDQRERAVLIGGAASLGVLAGAAAVLALRAER